MALTNFPNGVTSFGTPIVGGELPMVSNVGNYWFVDSVNGSTGGTGAYDAPYATTAAAISAAAAGDIIVWAPGHAETITAAGGITASKAGMQFYSMGSGTKRATFTFTTATTASFLITGAGVTINAMPNGAPGVVGISGVDALTNPFNIQAASVTANVEWQDPSSSFQAVRAVLTNASADKLVLNLKVIGITSGGTAPVNAVRLVGSDSAVITLDCYGRASTAEVEFVTTACSNVEVYGYVYNSGTTDGSKNVVDTVTGSTWYANFRDGAAGQTYAGGSGAALSVGATQTVPSADGTANALARDVIGNKTDASVYVPGTTNSIEAYVKGHADLQERVALKAAATITNGQTLFTVAGGPIEIMALVSICVTGNDGTASTVQYSVTPTSGSAQTISGASASIASAAAGASITLAGTALATAALYNANGPNLMANPGTIMAPAGTITAVVGVGSTTGTWRHYIRYKPLATGVTVS